MAVSDRQMSSFIYVLAANATSIDVLSIDSPGLALRQNALNLVGPTRAAGINISESPRSTAPLLRCRLTYSYTDANNLQGLTTFTP